jgi:hypothetical protein
MRCLAVVVGGGDGSVCKERGECAQRMDGLDGRMDGSQDARRRRRPAAAQSASRATTPKVRPPAGRLSPASSARQREKVKRADELQRSNPRSGERETGAATWTRGGKADLPSHLSRLPLLSSPSPPSPLSSLPLLLLCPPSHKPPTLRHLANDDARLRTRRTNPARARENARHIGARNTSHTVFLFLFLLPSCHASSRSFKRERARQAAARPFRRPRARPDRSAFTLCWEPPQISPRRH